MRVDEKLVDGPDLERAAEQRETLLAEKKDADLPELAGEEVRDVDGTHKDQLLGLMRCVLEERDVELEQIGLPQRELLALKALHSAVHGRTTNHETFLYAADRRSLLEQALAVLQPNLVETIDPQLAAMTAELRALTHQVTQLRETLMQLEDGQDDTMAIRPRHLKGRVVGLPVDDDVDPEASTLSDGPAATRPEFVSTLSKGRAVERAEPKSTLSDGPAVERAPHVSTLSKGRAVERDEAPTSLGDPAEIAGAAKPWWKRSR